MTTERDRLNLTVKARQLRREQRETFILQMPERELLPHIVRLLEHTLHTSAHVEACHGREEYGKDIVSVEDDPLVQKRVKAFVLKCGTVGGAATGKVDEIVSQVEEAWTTPAQLKDRAERLYVHEVHVVIAGRVTVGAVTKLQGRLRGRVSSILALDWLVEGFTERSPEFFFSGNELDALGEKIAELEAQRPFRELKSSKPLSEWFVPPRVALLEELQSFDNPLSAPLEVASKAFSDLPTLVKQHPRLLLVGDPGSGKSAAACKLAIDLMRKASSLIVNGEQQEPYEVPLFTTARRLVQYETVSDLMKAELGTLGPNVRASVLIVDALDELPGPQREAVLTKLESFAKDLDCHVLVTSRWIEALRKPVSGYKQVELVPFELSQALKLFGKVVDDALLLNELEKGLERFERMVQMVPLSLRMLVDVAREYREIPASINELYSQFLDYVLGRFDSERGIESLFLYRVKKSFLASLAYDEFFLKDRLATSRSEFMSYVDAFTVRYGLGAERVERLIAEIDRAGILRLDDSVEFIHRSYLDFFIADYLYTHQTEVEDIHALLVARYFNEIWSDTTFHFVGHSSQISRSILDRVFTYSEESLSVYVAKMTVGRLLQAGWNTEHATKISCIAQAIAWAPSVRKGFEPEARKEGESKPEALQDLLLCWISDTSFNSVALQSAVKEVLEKLLSDEDFSSLFQAALLLWAVRRRCGTQEFQALTQRFEGRLSSRSRPTTEEKTRLLAVLISAHATRGTRQKQTQRELSIRLGRILRRHPEIRDRVFVSPEKLGLPPGRREPGR